MQAANIEFCKKLFNRNIYLRNPYTNNVIPAEDRQVVNTEYVLGLADYYNAVYGLGDTHYRDNSTYATKQIADSQFATAISDNFLQGNLYIKNWEFRGDRWGDSNTHEERYSFEIYENAIYYFSLDFSRNLNSGILPAWIRIRDSNNTTILLLTGYYQGKWPKFPLASGRNTFSIALQKGYFIEAGAIGNKSNPDAVQFGVLNLLAGSLLKSNQVFIPTPIVTSAAGGTWTRIFPVVETASYQYSFSAHNQNYDAGSTNEKLVKVYYLSTSNVETVLYEPTITQDEVREDKISGTIKGTVGANFIVTVTKSGNNYGIVDRLTIKGTK
jgi:hypothetical protein